MSSYLPPGLRLLASLALPLATFLSAIVATQHVAAQFGVTLPTWSLALISILGLPVITTARILLKQIRDKRAANMLGARVVPKYNDSTLGNWGFIAEQMNSTKHGYPGDGLLEATKQYGPVLNFWPLWADIIFTTCPEHVKLILATDFDNYQKGPEFREEMFSVLGNGVFNADGDTWKFHRSLTRPHFLRDKITDFDLFDEHADIVIQKLKARCAAGYAVDFQDALHRFTMDTATSFLFGQCVHTLGSDLPYPHNVTPPRLGPPKPSPQDGSFRSPVEPNEFAAAFAAAQTMIVNRERKGWIWPFFEMFEDATVKPMKVVNAFIEPLVAEAIERKRTADRDPTAKLTEGESTTLLDELVKTTTDAKMLKDETLNVLVAGRDTTASTLTFVIHFLAMYPDVLARLRQEVLEKVGAARRPSFDDIKEMKYLRAVINETLRLYPVVPFNVRTAVEARVWPSPDPTQKPLYIPAGARTPYSVFLMHRRTELWGPDAEEFDPDRFLDERMQKYLLKNHFIFLPFNAGPRICLGQQFAYNEMSFFLIRLLQNFSSLSLAPEAGPPESRPPAAWSTHPGRKGMDKLRPKSHLTMFTDGGLWVNGQAAVEATEAA